MSNTSKITEKLFYIFLPCDWQDVSNIAHFVKGTWSHCFLWPTGSEWHCTFCERLSHHIFSYDQQEVSGIAYDVWKEVQSHLFLWPTGSEWHCTFCEKGSLITSFSLTNSESVMLQILWKIHILITSFAMTNREWVMLHICVITSMIHDQQKVSDIAHFVKGSLITSFPMTNRLWVTLHIWWKPVRLITSFPITTASEWWHCTFCERLSHHMFAYDKQAVSEIAHVVKGSLMTSFLMTNRLWVTLHIVWKAVSSHIFLQPTGCEWHQISCERLSHHIFSYNQQGVCHIADFVDSSLTTSLPITDSMWVPLHIFWKAVWGHLFLWPIAGECYCILCQWQSHHIFSYGQQGVSDVAHALKSLITSFPMTNRMSVTLCIFWRTVWSHTFLLPTGSE